MDAWLFGANQKQTFESLRHLTIEETYELADAILDKDVEEIKNETGDLLLHMVFYAKLGSELSEEEGGYDIADALHAMSWARIAAIVEFSDINVSYKHLLSRLYSSGIDCIVGIECIVFLLCTSKCIFSG